MIMVADSRRLGEWADLLPARDRLRIEQIHGRKLGDLRSLHEFDRGTRIATLRRMSGLTQDELAGLADVSRQTVSNWETGKSDPHLPNARRLAEVFDVPLDFFG